MVEQSEKLLSARNRYIAVAVAIVPFVLGVIQIWDYFFGANGPVFAASAQSIDFAYPNELWSQVDSLEDWASDNDRESKTPPPNVDNETFRYLDSMLSLTVRNTGSVPAEKTRLKLGFDGVAFIKWDTGITETKPFKYELPLGTIEVEKTVSITAWTSSYIPRQISVVHSTGQTAVSTVPPFITTNQIISALPFVAFLAFMGYLLTTLHYSTKESALRSHYSSRERELETEISNVKMEVRGLKHDAEMKSLTESRKAELEELSRKVGQLGDVHENDGNKPAPVS